MWKQLGFMGVCAAGLWAQNGSVQPNRVASAQGAQTLQFGLSNIQADGETHESEWKSLRTLQLRTTGKGAALIQYNAILTTIVAPLNDSLSTDTRRDVNGYVETRLQLLVDGVPQLYTQDVLNQAYLTLDSVGLTYGKAKTTSVAINEQRDYVLAFVQGARAMTWVVPGLTPGLHTFEIRGQVAISGFTVVTGSPLANNRYVGSSSMQRDVVIAEEIALQ
jgi:hypothetical protein